MAELDRWIEDHEDPFVYYGPREEDETPNQAFEDLSAEMGGDEWELLRAKPICLRRVEGEEALEFFDGEYERGWILCGKDQAGVPAWEIEVRYA